MKYRGIIEIEYFEIYKDFNTAQEATAFCESVIGASAHDHMGGNIKMTARIEFIANEEDEADE